MGKRAPLIPDSRSKEFWGDAEVIKCNPEVKYTSHIHRWKQQGPKATCTSCSVPHGIFLDILTQRVVDGYLVDTLTGKKLFEDEVEYIEAKPETFDNTP